MALFGSVCFSVAFAACWDLLVFRQRELSISEKQRTSQGLRGEKEPTTKDSQKYRKILHNHYCFSIDIETS